MLRVLFSFLLFSVTETAKAASDEIVIGDIFSIGGITSVFSTPYTFTIDYAVAEINASGGVLGKKLRIIRKNDKASPSLASSLAEELVLNDKVDFLIGGIDTGFCQAISEVAAKYKKVFFMSVCQSQKLTSQVRNPYIARATTATTSYVRAIAKYASKKFKDAHKWAVIAPANDYGKTVWREFSEEMKRNNPKFKTVGEFWPLPSESDMNGYIASIQASGADGLFSGLWGGMSISFLKQAAPFGFLKTMKYAGNSTGADEEIAALGKDAIVGGIGAGPGWTLGDTDQRYPDFREWQKKFLSKSGDIKPNAMVDLAYRTIYALAEVIKLAGSTESEKIVKILDKGFEYSVPWALKIEVRGCDHQAVVSIPVGEVVKKADGKYGFLAMELMPAKELYPTCQEITKMRAEVK